MSQVAIPNGVGSSVFQPISNLSVRAKIWLGFGFVLAVLLIQGMRAIGSLSDVQEEVRTIVEEVGPAVAGAVAVSKDVEAVGKSLGFYLLGKQEVEKQAYLDAVEAIQSEYSHFEEMAASAYFSSHSEYNETLDKLRADLKTLWEYKDRMVSLAENPGTNVIAMRYSGENINGLMRKANQLFAQMVYSEEEQEASPRRKKILLDIIAARYAWISVTTDLRLFLAFRNDSAIQNIEIYSKQLRERMKKLADYGDELTFEQEDALESLAETLVTYSANIKVVQKMHSGERWRTDAYLIKTEIGPLMSRIHVTTEMLIGVLGQALDTANNEVTATYERERLGFILGTLGVFILVAGIAIWLSNALTRPLSEAVKFARHIANGKLDNAIVARCEDETGQMLGALANMQDKLRQRIDSERELATENTRIRQALDDASASVLLLGETGFCIYKNVAFDRLMAPLESVFETAIPEFSLANLKGQSLSEVGLGRYMDLDAITQCTKLMKSRFSIEGHTFDLVVSPVTEKMGRRIGTILEWQEITQQLNTEKELARIVGAAKSGDLSLRVQVAKKIGFNQVLANGINELLSLVEGFFGEVSASVESMSKGDLRNNISGEYDGSFARLKDHMNASLRTLSDIIEEAGMSCQHIAQTAMNISDGNDKLANRTEAQASSLQETASTMEELTATVKQTADNALRATDIARRASSEAGRGQESLKILVEAMDEISNMSNEISEITSSIDEIAFQTNLLALNASVEAARAGEHGKGFAVVAGEVRHLARRSTDAARKIKGLIHKTVDKVKTGNRVVIESSELLDGICSAVERSVSLVEEISLATAEQSEGLTHTNGVITQIDVATQDNAALAVIANSASTELTELATGLEARMAFFAQK